MSPVNLEACACAAAVAQSEQKYEIVIDMIGWREGRALSKNCRVRVASCRFLFSVQPKRFSRPDSGGTPNMYRYGAPR